MSSLDRTEVIILLHLEDTVSNRHQFLLGPQACKEQRERRRERGGKGREGERGRGRLERMLVLAEHFHHSLAFCYTF